MLVYCTLHCNLLSENELFLEQDGEDVCYHSPFLCFVDYGAGDRLAVSQETQVSFASRGRGKLSYIRFRASFSDPSNRLSSWNWKNKDCCAWQGVECDRITRHVTMLDLKYNETTIDNMLQSEMLDSSLLELKHLQYLDLSWISFKRRKIRAFLESMLQHLNFSWANF
ncbi:hypothetical protein C2S53_008398 [Perilla frutescens var. hirtella]|uniref:Leucine-rich repeat-containing N-terminal plant-type domain-containing protein n=1 Tax=Perilla frutescens var. hirtella TaxID=608512 RepID=A0AAD4NZJ6_PERFH|nr:hypothetical protein C2S53_008398 [Perilla frutescens var. hirtella]